MAHVTLTQETDGTYAILARGTTAATNARLRRAKISWFLGFDPKSPQDRTEVERRITTYVGADVSVVRDAESIFDEMTQYADQDWRADTEGDRWLDSCELYATTLKGEEAQIATLLISTLRIKLTPLREHAKTPPPPKKKLDGV